MTTCIPIANGVPALPGPPNWFDNSVPVPQFWDQFDDRSDPRWRGAARKSFGVGAVEHLAFRALYSPVTSPPAGTPTAYLYLAWNIDVDGSVDLNADGVHLGLQRAGGPAYVFKVTAWSSAADSPNAARVPQPSAFKLVGSTWTAEPLSTWIWANVAPFGTARAWLKNATASVTTNKWAVHIRVPLINGGDISNVGINLGAIGSTFKLWFDVDTIGPGGVTEYPYPSTAVITQDASLNDVYPMPADWSDASVGGANCGVGVSLNGWDIGTTNPDPTEIKFKYPPGGPNPAPVNTLYAKPLNTGPPIGAGVLSATFRTANWGTQPDWNDVTDPNTLWREVLPAVAKTNDASGTIQFPWTLTDAEAAEIAGPSPTRRAHNCMYVELAGPGVEFLNDSAYQNMNYAAQASEFTSDAEASIAGLKALAGSTHRDVFLFVDTRNMPATLSEGETGKPVPKPEPPGPAPGDGHEDDGEDEGHEDVGHDEVRPDVGDDELGRDIRANLTFEDVARLAPTYMVHAFHDTGRKRRINGLTMKVLAPQTSFGYFIGHSGTLAGWEHELSGPGLQQLADNYYKIRVPNGGSMPLRIQINALEKARPSWWWLWLLIRRIIRWVVSTIRKLLGK